jgi:hypothetical protein
MHVESESTMKIPKRKRTKLDRLRATLGTGTSIFVPYQSGTWPLILRHEGLRVRWRKTPKGWAAWVEPLETEEARL